MGDPTMTGMAIKEGVEVVENSIEIADQLLNLKDKREQISDEKKHRELELHKEEISIFEKKVDTSKKVVDNVMDLIIKGVDAKDKHLAEKRQRIYEEKRNDLTLRKEYYDITTERGIKPSPEVLTEFEDTWKSEEKSNVKSKDRGSKVKNGVFAECSIEMFDDESGIIINKDTQEVFMLTSDNIQSYKLVKTKMRGTEKYYYYHITFRDNQRCFVRIRGKYKDAMIRSMDNINNIQSDELE